MPIPPRQRGEAAKAGAPPPSNLINWGATISQEPMTPQQLMQLQMMRQMENDAPAPASGGGSRSDPGGRKKAGGQGSNTGGRQRNSETMWASRWRDVPVSASNIAEGPVPLHLQAFYLLRRTTSSAGTSQLVGNLFCIKGGLMG